VVATFQALLEHLERLRELLDAFFDRLEIALFRRSADETQKTGVIAGATVLVVQSIQRSASARSRRSSGQSVPRRASPRDSARWRLIPTARAVVSIVARAVRVILR